MHLPTGYRSNLNKQKQQMFSMWSAGIDFEFAGLGIRKLLNASYRKVKYAEIMAWGKELGIKIVVDGIANPDLVRKSLPDIQIITSNLKERYLALSTK